jgi:Ca2+-binding RTX toxin-like protein
MAGIIQNRSQTAGPVVTGVEGITAVWNISNLTYSFATTADAAVTTTEILGPGSVYTGTFNALDTETSYRNSVLRAFAAYSQVSNLTFSASSDFATADIKVAGVDNFGATGVNGILLGVGDFPGTNIKGTSTSDFESYLRLNTTGPYAGLDIETGAANALNSLAIHEFGHVLGLGHPHDNGNGTQPISLPDVNTSPASENVSDNERYTAMSYERGGLDVQIDGSFGHLITPSPLDIAAIQAIYGANPNTNSTDTTYTLLDRDTGVLDVDGSDGTVQIGRAFYSIWDTGGTDKIAYSGSRRVVLNLNDASLSTTDDVETLEWIEDVKSAKNYTSLPNELRLDLQDVSYHSGGFFSRITNNAGFIGSIQNIFSSEIDLGGYSIANGVKIENASASDGDDFLIGNELDNTLEGKSGNDFLHGSSGNDNLQGGAGDDEFVGGRGDDTIDGGDDKDLVIYSGKCADYDVTRDEGTGLITIAHVRGSKTDGTDVIKNVEKARFTDSAIDLTQPGKILGCPPIDFIFLVDLSGSYSDDLPNFVTSARSIARSVRSLDPSSQFAVASFIDRPENGGDPSDYLYQPELALTDSVESFESSLSKLKIGNGGDFPEAQYVGLWRAANGVGLNLRENSRKVILIATDAPPHSAADYGLDETNILNFLNREGIFVAARSATDTAVTNTSSTIKSASVAEGNFFAGKIRTATDTENGLTPSLPKVDPLAAEVKRFFDTTGVTPIFAVTSGAKTGYEEIQKFLGRGTTVTVDSAGTNISDAVRQAIAEVAGTITNGGTDGNDTLVGSDAVKDALFGGIGDDRLEGRAENDTLDGGSDDDTVLGEGGNDLIQGGTGSDTLDGGDGDDTIESGEGIDNIVLGAGKDVLRGTAAELEGDLLQDFTIEDQIVVLGKSYEQIQITATANGNSILTSAGNNLLILTGEFSSSDFTVVSSGTGDALLTTISLDNKTAAFSLNPATNTFATGAVKSQLRLNLGRRSDRSLSEIGLFKVDDAAGNIGGVAPDAANYLQVALDRAVIGFSSLKELPKDFATDAARTINLDEKSFYRFYLAQNSTTDAVLGGKSPLTSINLSSPTSLQIAATGTDSYTLGWKDGGTDFSDLVVNAQLTTQLLPTGADLQAKPRSEILDFRNFDGQKINAKFTVNRKALYNNYVGFYEITDEQGTILDAATGKSFTAESAGYALAAVKNRIAGIDLRVEDDGQAILNGSFDGGKLFAPFLIVNGYIDQLFDKFRFDDPAVYFPFLGANSDRTDHVRLLGDNLFGFEDLPNGGDFDYNDITVKMNFTVI